MQLREHKVGTIAVVDVSGNVTQIDAESLLASVGRLLDRGHREIVLDMADLTHVDSAALGSLVASQIRADKAGARMKLANAGKRLTDMLVVTRLVTVFDAYESLSAALASFDPH